MVRDLRARGIRCEVIFLHADDNILLKRYGETRRKHPLSAAGLSLREAIDRERQLLGPIIASAELVLDTTRTSIYELRDIIRRRVGAHEQPGLSILIESFGYKHGIPADADFVFDLRCLPNPYWDMALRPLTGKDEKVIEFLDASDSVQRMYGDILGFLDRWIPEYIDFNRNYLTVAIGCTGGQHRSVYMTEKLAAELAKRYSPVMTRHNELPEKEGRIQVPQFGGAIGDALVGAPSGATSPRENRVRAFSRGRGRAYRRSYDASAIFSTRTRWEYSSLRSRQPVMPAGAWMGCPSMKASRSSRRVMASS